MKLGRSLRREACAGMDAVSLLGLGVMDCCDGTGLCSGGSLGSKPASLMTAMASCSDLASTSRTRSDEEKVRRIRV